MSKTLSVTLTKLEEIKQWNQVSNHYARSNTFMSRSLVLRILIREEYERLKIVGIIKED